MIKIENQTISTVSGIKTALCDGRRSERRCCWPSSCRRDKLSDVYRCPSGHFARRWPRAACCPADEQMTLRRPTIVCYVFYTGASDLI